MIYTPPSQYPQPSPAYLQPTRFFDFDSEPIARFARETTHGAGSEIEKAVKLFYAVRDGWRYDPFRLSLRAEDYVASTILAQPATFCIPKAILLVAAARAVGIPAAIGLSDVVNHLNTEKLRRRMGGKDLFIHHGFALLFLDGRWVKAAPAFNIELCTRFGVAPTEFDGRSDAIFQEYDAYSRRHMEYVNERGFWSDFPYEQVAADFAAFYPPEAFAGAEAAERFEDDAPRRDSRARA